jgi:hypothetical protein
MENLLCQRFNFFLVIFSVVLAGAANANTQVKQTAILALGTIVSALIGLTIYRNYTKLMVILERLHGTPHHPVAVTGALVKRRPLRGLFGVNPIIGIYVPIICTISLAVGALCSWRGYLKAS